MHLNNKGFAISGVLYSMLILIVTLMFLILGILDRFLGWLNVRRNDNNRII